MKTILLDTHAALWSAADKLSPAHQTLILIAGERDCLLMSPVSAWEIGMLVAKGRLRLPVAAADFVNDLFAGTNVTLAALTAEIAFAATTLPGNPHGDPMDRMLIATAAAYDAELMTRDRRIIEYAKKTKYIRCIAC